MANGEVDERASETRDSGPAPLCRRSPLGTFGECPHCGGAMTAEHAHYRCTGCGWRDSCCD